MIFPEKQTAPFFDGESSFQVVIRSKIDWEKVIFIDPPRLLTHHYELFPQWYRRILTNAGFGHRVEDNRPLSAFGISPGTTLEVQFLKPSP